MKTNILIIGAGQIGSRHLQALASLHGMCKIYVVDPCCAALKTAQKRYIEVRKETSPSVNYSLSIDELPVSKFKLVVVASNAKHRVEIVHEIVEKLSVVHLVLEKVLAQTPQQLDFLEELVANAGISAWVNCPRRMYPAYRQLAKHFKNCESVSLSVSGVNWGLACNAIHFLDLWHYLADFSDYSLKYETETLIIDSKRIGYHELIGGLYAKTKDNNHHLSLSCSHDEDQAVSLDITASFADQSVKLDENLGFVKWLGDDGKIIQTLPLQVLFQSQLTDKVLLSLVETNNCLLTPLAESVMLHKEFLRKTIQLFVEERGTGYDLAPIT